MNIKDIKIGHKYIFHHFKDLEAHTDGLEPLLHTQVTVTNKNSLMVNIKECPHIALYPEELKPIDKRLLKLRNRVLGIK